MSEETRYFKKMEGELVYLSPMNPDDYISYTRWINDLEISRGLGNSTSSFSLPTEKEIVEKLSREGHNYAIIKKEDDTLLGNCSLFAINHIHRHAEMGIFIGEKSAHNCGYGKDAIKLILSYGFKVLNLHNIMLKVLSFNENAVAAYSKIGFRECGRRREAVRMNGKFYDDIFMDILDKEFQCPYLDDKLPR